MGVPYQEHAVHRREVCDGHYRAEFGETLEDKLADARKGLGAFFESISVF